MNETSDKKSERDLIDHAHGEKIMPNTKTKTRCTTKSDKREEIIYESEKEYAKRKEDQKING
jgi:hypothetical protein